MIRPPFSFQSEGHFYVSGTEDIIGVVSFISGGTQIYQSVQFDKVARKTLQKPFNTSKQPPETGGCLLSAINLQDYCHGFFSI